MTMLSDVEVETLGLVEAGANKEEFFVLKSDDPSDARIAKGVLAFLSNAMHNELSRLDKSTDKSTDDSTDESVDKSVDESTQPESDAAAEPAVDESITVEAASGDLNKEEAPVVEEPEAVDEVSKETTMDELNKSVEEQIAELAKSNSELADRLADAEAKLAKAKEDGDRMVYLAKARTITALPVSPDELADHLYWLAKADPTRAEWLEGVLAAADKQMNDAAFYGELGTVASPVTQDEVAKAAAAEDPREALLAVSPDAAREYLLNRRREINKAR